MVWDKIDETNLKRLHKAQKLLSLTLESGGLIDIIPADPRSLVVASILLIGKTIYKQETYRQECIQSQTFYID